MFQQDRGAVPPISGRHELPLVGAASAQAVPLLHEVSVAHAVTQAASALELPGPQPLGHITGIVHEAERAAAPENAKARWRRAALQGVFEEDAGVALGLHGRREGLLLAASSVVGPDAVHVVLLQQHNVRRHHRRAYGDKPERPRGDDLSEDPRAPRLPGEDLLLELHQVLEELQAEALLRELGPQEASHRRGGDLPALVAGVGYLVQRVEADAPKRRRDIRLAGQPPRTPQAPHGGVVTGRQVLVEVAPVFSIDLRLLPSLPGGAGGALHTADKRLVTHDHDPGHAVGAEAPAEDIVREGHKLRTILGNRTSSSWHLPLRLGPGLIAVVTTVWPLVGHQRSAGPGAERA
mmetsp:Transcript_60789/g.181112  ORF Transcript_60789/g.181112 Transcript_60789/m.181112 type:complete len:350 (+) Transcript_60789:744-1793(+)